MRRILVVIALLPLVFSLFLTPIEALASAPAPRGIPRVTPVHMLPPVASTGGTEQVAASATFSPTVSIRLPVVFNNYREKAQCSLDSPFSLEIAAIHQIAPAGAQAVADGAEAEWLARYEAGFPSLVDALRDSGACWTRIEISWRKIQPNALDPFDWSFFDEKLGLLADAGVQTIAIIDKVPDWAGPHQRGPIYADHLDEFQQFLTAVVNRYKEQPYDIHHWELFNEADWVDATDPENVLGWGFKADKYTQMLRDVAHPVIKGIDPGATILMGGLAYDAFEEYSPPHGSCTTCPFHRYFPDDVIAAGGAPYFDLLNFHYFPDYHLEWEQWSPPPPTCGAVYDGVGTTYDSSGVDLIAKTNHFRNRLSTCMGTTKPIWVTELGDHGVEGVPESLAQQSRYVLKGYARGLAAGVKNITWFTLVSPPYDPFDQGLLYVADWSPKPAYFTYQTLTHQLAGYAYNHTTQSGAAEAYVFSRAGRPDKTVAWAEPGPEPLVFSSASQLIVTDRLGDWTIIHDGGPGDQDGVVNGEVRLQLTNDPVIILH